MKKIFIYSLICGLISIIPFYFAFMIMSIPEHHIRIFGAYLITIIILACQYVIYFKTKNLGIKPRNEFIKVFFLIISPILCCLIGYETINSIYLIRFLKKENIEIIPMTFFSGLLDNGFNRKFIGFGIITPIVISSFVYLVIEVKKKNYRQQQV